MEWKHKTVIELVERARLETFLSGMETCRASCRGTRRDALKPSLVEWKPNMGGHLDRIRLPLETFLSGMETQVVNIGLADQVLPLKPSLVEWKLKIDMALPVYPTTLETFLSGMETPLPSIERTPCPKPLKPSLVEWKPIKEDGYTQPVVP